MILTLELVREYIEDHKTCFNNDVLETLREHDHAKSKLEHKLNQQSTALAEALKAKNDALDRLTFKQDELDARNKTLADWHRANDRLREDLITVRKQLQFYGSELGNRMAELAKANLELQKLRPAEPKFHVDQVVMNTCLRPIRPIKISGRRHLGTLGYVYSFVWAGGCAEEVNEAFLRTLTVEEINGQEER